MGPKRSSDCIAWVEARNRLLATSLARYNEALILYVLGLGSPTHPLPKKSYLAWTSTYRWKGEIQQDQEVLLIIKTTSPRLAALEQAIREHSKYELPELLALPVVGGAADYLAWVGESVAKLED